MKTLLEQLTLTIKDVQYKKYFPEDKQPRYVFKLQLKRRGNGSYTFNFGQSIAAGAEEPTLTEVLECLQKYDVGDFEEFCSTFGYDNDSRTAERTYKAVCKEYEAMSRLFTSEELELLNNIEA
jgi:hypothetical protein